MSRVIAGVALLVAAAGTLGAQASPNGWQLTGTVGAQFRGERGKVIDGAVLEVGAILPSSSATRWGFDAGVAQMNAHNAANKQVIESAFEGDVLVMRDLMRRGEWRLEGGVGPVVAYGVGCRHESTGPTDSAPTGAIPCVDPAAEKGTVRVGARARLLGEWMSPRAAFFAALTLNAHTVSSGDGLSPALVVGIRTPSH
jgi:hypothetical protein